jgi:hypothetical protein
MKNANNIWILSFATMNQLRDLILDLHLHAKNTSDMKLQQLADTLNTLARRALPTAASHEMKQYLDNHSKDESNIELHVKIRDTLSRQR